MVAETTSESLSMQTARPDSADIVVIGGGIAGVSVAAELAADRRVVLLEMEDRPGYHTTGRSAAVYAQSYGPAPIRQLTVASEPFFQDPPEGFTDSPLFAPRAVLMIAREDQLGTLDRLTDAVAALTEVERLSGDRLMACQPLLRPDYVREGMLDRLGQDIDVNALHQGYLRLFRQRGGTVLTGAEVTGLAHDGTGWRIETPRGEISAEIVVNAAGAWADSVGRLAGAEQVGLVPKRRTAMTIADHPEIPTAALPITIDVDEEFYLKPESGRLLISPADETPSDPCDAQPEELDIAIGADRIMTAFDLNIRRIESSWAGLRSFVADKAPVAGFSDRVPGFFWLAGQGGYGIQSAPALAHFAAASVLGRAPSDALLNTGLDPASLAPSRLEKAA